MDKARKIVLPDVKIAIERVKVRVSQGGHNVPENVVRRRFDKGLANFHDIYKGLADVWIEYDSSGENPILIDSGENG